MTALKAAALLAQAQAPAIIFGTELLGQDKAEHLVMALADPFL
jgi:thiamine pyrophosphate-dependent acetolactate synthase large subunit-like protein